MWGQPTVLERLTSPTVTAAARAWAFEGGSTGAMTSSSYGSRIAVTRGSNERFDQLV